MKKMDSLSLTRILLTLSLILLTACLTIGFLLVQLYAWAAVSLLNGGIWLFSRRHAASWLPALCLVLSVSLAVAGKLMGLHALLSIGSCGLALVVWDLLSLDMDIGSNQPEEQTRAYEINHLQSLALAVGGAFFAAVIGQFLRVKIPFYLLAACILLAILGLDRVWKYLAKKR